MTSLLVNLIAVGEPVQVAAGCFYMFMFISRNTDMGQLEIMTLPMSFYFG
jgi:hypothetical protein